MHKLFFVPPEKFTFTQNYVTLTEDQGPFGRLRHVLKKKAQSRKSCKRLFIHLVLPYRSHFYGVEGATQRIPDVEASVRPLSKLLNFVIPVL